LPPHLLDIHGPREVIIGDATISYHDAVSELGVGLIHVWGRETIASDYERYRATLSADERVQCDRFHFARDRYDYANAHDLLRTTLSRYDATPPEAWRFEAMPHGKPVLVADSPDAAPVTFNLSHTRGVVACVVSRGTPVGIDVERGDRLRNAMAIASRFFSPREAADLRRCGDHDRQRRFIELWTLKEAFIKATGKGLSQPLNAFTFGLDEEHVIRFTPPTGVAFASWQFAQYALTPDAIVAIAVCGAAAWPPILRVLGGEAALEMRPHRTTHCRMKYSNRGPE
jgi:4'-phosphopantetheinyl transferase